MVNPSNAQGRRARYDTLVTIVVFVLAATTHTAAAWSFDAIKLTFEEGYQLNSVVQRGIETPRLQTPILDSKKARRAFSFTVDPGTQHQVWLSDTHVSSGRHSLAFKIYSNVDRDIKDKIELDVVKHYDPEKLVVGDNNRRYLSFDFMLDPGYETPSHWALHVQAWQCCGGRPPFAIFVTPNTDKNSNVEFIFMVRDDESDAKNPTTLGGTIIHRMIVPRGQWSNMVIQLEPSHNGDNKIGQIAMWHNGALKFSQRANWGYRSGRSSHTDDPRGMIGEMGIKIGTYRRRQPTTQIIYFDNVRYGLTYQSVTE